VVDLLSASAAHKAIAHARVSAEKSPRAITTSVRRVMQTWTAFCAGENENQPAAALFEIKSTNVWNEGVSTDTAPLFSFTHVRVSLGFQLVEESVFDIK